MVRRRAYWKTMVCLLATLMVFTMIVSPVGSVVQPTDTSTQVDGENETLPTAGEVDRIVTADREINDTTAEPGETVRVRVSVALENGSMQLHVNERVNSSLNVSQVDESDTRYSKEDNYLYFSWGDATKLGDDEYLDQFRQGYEYLNQYGVVTKSGLEQARDDNRNINGSDILLEVAADFRRGTIDAETLFQYAADFRRGDIGYPGDSDLEELNASYQTQTPYIGVKNGTAIYDVTIPENATAGTTYQFSGSVEEAYDEIEVATTGNTTIEVVE